MGELPLEQKLEEVRTGLAAASNSLATIAGYLDSGAPRGPVEALSSLKAVSNQLEQWAAGYIEVGPLCNPSDWDIIIALQQRALMLLQHHPQLNPQQISKGGVSRLGWKVLNAKLSRLGRILTFINTSELHAVAPPSKIAELWETLGPVCSLSACAFLTFSQVADLAEMLQTLPSSVVISDGIVGAAQRLAQQMAGKLGRYQDKVEALFKPLQSQGWHEQALVPAHMIAWRNGHHLARSLAIGAWNRMHALLSGWGILDGQVNPVSQCLPKALDLSTLMLIIRSQRLLLQLRDLRASEYYFSRLILGIERGNQALNRLLVKLPPKMQERQTPVAGSPLVSDLGIHFVLSLASFLRRAIQECPKIKPPRETLQFLLTVTRNLTRWVHFHPPPPRPRPPILKEPLFGRDAYIVDPFGFRSKLWEDMLRGQQEMLSRLEGCLMPEAVDGAMRNAKKLLDYFVKHTSVPSPSAATGDEEVALSRRVYMLSEALYSTFFSMTQSIRSIGEPLAALNMVAACLQRLQLWLAKGLPHLCRLVPDLATNDDGNATEEQHQQIAGPKFKLRKLPLLHFGYLCIHELSSLLPLLPSQIRADSDHLEALPMALRDSVLDIFASFLELMPWVLKVWVAQAVVIKTRDAEIQKSLCASLPGMRGAVESLSRALDRFEAARGGSNWDFLVLDSIEQSFAMLRLRDMLTPMQKTTRIMQRVMGVDTVAIFGACEKALSRLQRIIEDRPVTDLYDFAIDLIGSRLGEQGLELGANATQGDNDPVRQSKGAFGKDVDARDDGSNSERGKIANRGGEAQGTQVIDSESCSGSEEGECSDDSDYCGSPEKNYRLLAQPLPSIPPRQGVGSVKKIDQGLESRETFLQLGFDGKATSAGLAHDPKFTDANRQATKSLLCA